MRAPLKVAVVASPSTRELAVTFADLPHAAITWLCTPGSTAEAFGAASRLAPSCQATTDFNRLLDDDELDAIAFDCNATERSSLPAEALAAGKHVFVRGPLASTLVESDALISLAEANRRCLRVYHRGPLSPGTRRLRQLIRDGALGEVFYVRAVHGGILRPDQQLLWDWGADLTATVLELLGDQPIEVTARGDSHAFPDTLETVIADLSFATGITAQLHLSGIDHCASNRIAVIGSEATAVLDADAPRELGLFVGSPEGSATERSSDVSIAYPSLTFSDPLHTACKAFVAAARAAWRPGGCLAAAAVVSVLELIHLACQDKGGAPARNVAERDLPSVIQLHGV